MITEKYVDIDGIKVFHQDIMDFNDDFNAEGIDYHSKLESNHFWYVARREFIVKKFLKFISMESKIIEIGAGTGHMSRELIKSGYKNFAVGEMHLNGLRYAKQNHIEECYQFDLLRTPFKEEFDIVCMFDVLEHIQDEKSALENVNNMLKGSGGMVVLTLPAHQWLWSVVDEATGHKRRYSKKHLNKVLAESGFEIIEMQYFFTFLVPLFLLRSLLNIRNKGKGVAEVNSGAFIGDFTNSTLKKLSRFENKFRKFVPEIFGSSLFAIARKI